MGINSGPSKANDQCGNDGPRIRELEFIDEKLHLQIKRSTSCTSDTS